MGKKRKGIVGELSCDLQTPILEYRINNKEDEILRDKTYIKFWKRGLRRKTFSRHLKSNLKKELKKYKAELKKDRKDLAKLRAKLRKCM
ncbi:MAG: hypothetical protein PVI03_01400 [Candidatus Thorarchaeota archaeon]|jgi:hypothetical protein